MAYNRMETGTAGPAQAVQQNDLFRILHAMYKIFTKIWLGMCLLFVAVFLAVTGYEFLHYEESYRAYVTVAISKDSGNTQDDQQLAARIGSSFKHLLTIHDFYTELDSHMKELGAESASVSLTAQYTSDTNFVTITAVSSDGEWANETISLVLTELRDLVSVVSGSFSYSVVELEQPKETVISAQEKHAAILRFILIGLAAGAACVLGFLFLSAYLSDAVRSFDDIRRRMDLHKLGELPSVRGQKTDKNGQKGVSFLNKRLPHYYRDSIYLALARTEKSMREKDLRTLLITSSVPREGKTTISCNLALAMAERGEKVLLLDCDLRSPSVARTIGVTQVASGITDVLYGKVTMQEARICLGEGKPDLLVGNKRVEDTDDLLTSRQMSKLMEEAREHYDYVIIDTPPSAMLMDASILAGYVDAAVYVVRQDYTRIQSIEEGIHLLEHSGAEVLGCIINCADHRMGYGYGYGYGYGSRSYSGYGQKKDRKSKRRES